MVYRMEKNAVTPCGETAPPSGGLYMGVFPLEGGEGLLPERLRRESFLNRTPRFVSHEGMDMLCLSGGAPEKQGAHAVFYLFLQRSRLWIFCTEPAAAERLIERLREDGAPEYSFGGIICGLLRLLLADDSGLLERFEQRVNTLEDEVLESRRKNCTGDIIRLRKRLTALSRYYEQLLDLFDEIALNENGLFDARTLKLLKIVDGKVGRLYSNVQHLRDYVTQVREAYQSEVDIQLNRTMKLFTVLTAIFLPLTLVAGWYGMNFDMPEYHSALGYPVVIAASVLLVAGTILLFKKNRWF